MLSATWCRFVVQLWHNGLAQVPNQFVALRRAEPQRMLPEPNRISRGIRVARYLAQLSPGPAAETAVESTIRRAALVESPELSSSTPTGELPFGYSGSYWLDLRTYDPVSQASALDKPMLILQGGRDYQVTVEDDLSRWKEGLGHRSGVTIRIYEVDNHLFFPGTGPSTPAEYDPAQHVDPSVVADIATWLRPQRGVFARFVSSVFRLKQ